MALEQVIVGCQHNLAVLPAARFAVVLLGLILAELSSTVVEPILVQPSISYNRDTGIGVHLEGAAQGACNEDI